MELERKVKFALSFWRESEENVPLLQEKVKEEATVVAATMAESEVAVVVKSRLRELRESCIWRNKEQNKKKSVWIRRLLVEERLTTGKPVLIGLLGDVLETLSHYSVEKTPEDDSNNLVNKKSGDGPSTRKGTQKSSRSVCKYWMNGNCTHGDRCWNFHSWFQGNGLSVVAKLHEHKKIVTGIVLPVGSDKLFSGSTDGTVRIWDCHTGQCVSVINLGGEVRSLICEGTWVFAGMPNAVKAWNIQTAAEFTLDGPKGQVLAMAVGNDTLFAGAKDGVIYAWRGSSETKCPFEPVAALNGHTKAIVCLTVGLGIGGKMLYSGSMDRSIKVWDLNTLLCTMTLNAHTDVVTSLVCWYQYLMSSSSDGTIKIWAATEAGTLEVVYTHREEHGVVALSGMTDVEGKHILFCSCNNHSVSLYELPTFSRRGQLFSKQEVRAIELGPSGLFFTGDGTGLMTVWKWL
ncbi:Zinc finger CCCH domain-containing protein 48 [Senna tora]|uniref:Zinc finger CCCH domain-containing protein 48 n=1 Tax=Senna tora TaxID=362788 RepID=A0A834SWC9_9FABA|nr:Zinc finger CCCH domain-containing protein 48 [Senna tora]